MVRSHKWGGLYGLVGGHVELGETLQEALGREVKEETGLDIASSKFLMPQECIFDKRFWQHSHFIFFEFVCQVDSSDVVLNSEAESFEWISPRDALSLDLDLYTGVAIHRYLKNSRGD